MNMTYCQSFLGFLLTGYPILWMTSGRSGCFNSKKWVLNTGFVDPWSDIVDTMLVTSLGMPRDNPHLTALARSLICSLHAAISDAASPEPTSVSPKEYVRLSDVVTWKDSKCLRNLKVPSWWRQLPLNASFVSSDGAFSNIADATCCWAACFASVIRFHIIIEIKAMAAIVVFRSPLKTQTE